MWYDCGLCVCVCVFTTSYLGKFSFLQGDNYWSSVCQILIFRLEKAFLRDSCEAPLHIISWGAEPHILAKCALNLQNLARTITFGIKLNKTSILFILPGILKPLIVLRHPRIISWKYFLYVCFYRRHLVVRYIFK